MKFFTIKCLPNIVFWEKMRLLNKGRVMIMRMAVIRVGGNKRATSEDGHLLMHFCCKRWNRVIIKVNIADYKYIRGN